MHLSLFERNRNRTQSATPIFPTDGNAACAVNAVAAEAVRSWAPRIVRADGTIDLPVSGAPAVTARAEVKAKRFIGNKVREERFEATVAADDGSPQALLSALTRAFAEVAELRTGGGSDERLILSINLVV